MRPDQLKEFPDHLKYDIANAATVCPYSKGKLLVSKYAKISRDKAKALINALQFKVGGQTTYEELKKQTNLEKEIHFNLTHGMVKERMDIAYQYHLDHLSTTKIDMVHILGIAVTHWEDLSAKLHKYFEKINEHIKTNFSAAYNNGIVYDTLKHQLSEKGVRKTANGENHGFDSLCEVPIITQLVVNTLVYMRYLYSTHTYNVKFSLDLTTAKAPKFRFFSGQFGGITSVRKAVTDTFFEHIDSGNLQNFFDEDGKFGITNEALQKIEEKLADIHPDPKRLENHASHFFLLDENIYGCPVTDMFHKFYRMTLAALIAP